MRKETPPNPESGFVARVREMLVDARRLHRGGATKEEVRERINGAWRFAQSEITDNDTRERALRECGLLGHELFGDPLPVPKDKSPGGVGFDDPLESGRV